MALFPCLPAALAAVALSAPAPDARPAELDKYLPDDSTFVLAVNVRQVVAWAPFQKQVQGQAEKLLATEPVQAVLKDVGFDPLRDVEGVVVAAANSGPEAAGRSEPPEGGPTFVVARGKFNSVKIRAKLEQLGKDMPGTAASHKVGDAELWEIGTGGNKVYFAVLDAETVMATRVEGQATEALEKAAGKRKTALKSKQMRDLLAKRDPGRAAEWFAVGDLRTGMAIPADGSTPARPTYLKDGGIESFHGGVSLGDADLRFQSLITTRDAETAKHLADDMSRNMEHGAANVKAAAQNNNDLAPLVDVMKSIKVTASDEVVALSASATPEGAVAAVKGWFTVTPPAPAPVAVPKPDR